MTEHAPDEQPPHEPPEGAPPEPKTFDAEYVANLRKEAAKYRTEAKANAEAAKRLADMEARNLSDVERAQQAANEAQSRLAEYERTVLRQKVALEKGVPASLVGRLVGDTEDEIAADADALLALVNAPTSPKPDLSQGARGNTTPSTPGEQFADFINRT